MGEGAGWLTLTPPGLSELEITLFIVAEGAMFDKDTVPSMTSLIKKDRWERHYLPVNTYLPFMKN
jgi:hypothetical protein